MEELEMLMLAIGIFAVGAILVTLTDTALRGRNAYRALTESRNAAGRADMQPKVTVFDGPVGAFSMKSQAANDVAIRLPAAA